MDLDHGHRPDHLAPQGLGLRDGGDTGPAVVPGHPDRSLLLKRVHAKDMPPPKELIRAGVRPLQTSEIARITQWIAQGARRYDIAADVQTDQPDTLVTAADRRLRFRTRRVEPRLSVSANVRLAARTEPV